MRKEAEAAERARRTRNRLTLRVLIDDWNRLHLAGRYKSKRCDPRPKARDVPLTWARASAYRDRAIEYLKLAHLAPDRNGRSRFLEIVLHYRTLEIERCAADRTAHHQSQNTINWSRSGPLTSVAFVLLTIISGISGVMTTVPFDLARASDCLAAPNSPPEGKSLVLPPKPRDAAKVLARALV